MSDRFDQLNPAHQDWLMGQLERQVANGFYVAQDIADLLQGLPWSRLFGILATYHAQRELLEPAAFLEWLVTRKLANGTAADWEWEQIEAAARLKHWPQRRRA
jgi:hypothetical protein